MPESSSSPLSDQQPSGSSPGSHQQIQMQKEALTRASTHVRYLAREGKNVPPLFGRFVELLCTAFDLLIEAERLPLMQPSKSDPDGSVRADLATSLHTRALKQIEIALNELASLSGKDLDENALAEEAKSLVVLAFRNGPIEDVHAGKTCPTCGSASEYSRITDPEMKLIMKAAVNKVYTLLRVKTEDPARYKREVEFGKQYTYRWDEPTYSPDLLLP